MADGLSMLRVASVCDDCRRCWRGNPEEAGGGIDLERVVREVVGRVRSESARDQNRLVPVGVSVRHIHLNQETLDQLYGAGSRLTKLRDLYQPGAYAADQTITLIGSRMRAIERVRVLGPLRDYVQVELSRTDGVLLGINLPVRDSGNLEGASLITLVGPEGSLTLPAAIRAIRHVHLGPKDVIQMGLRDTEKVRVRTTGPKALHFENVSVKVSNDYIPELHLDTDDANAADLVCSDSVEIEQ